MFDKVGFDLYFCFYGLILFFCYLIIFYICCFVVCGEDMMDVGILSELVFFEYFGVYGIKGIVFD